MPASPALHRRPAVRALTIAVLLTLALHLTAGVPGVRWLQWPLLLISTLAHELGHGLFARLLGAQFDSLVLWPNGAGVASYHGHFSAFSIASIAAAGLLGPPFTALLLMLAGRHSRAAHIALGACAVFLVLVTVLWAGSLFTWIVCLALAAVAGLLAWRGSPEVSQIACLFLAVQLSLSVFARGDYLFMRTAQTGAGPMPSDVSQIASALWLPYWLWGGLIAALSLALLGLGAWRFLRALS